MGTQGKSKGRFFFIDFLLFFWNNAKNKTRHFALQYGSARPQLLFAAIVLPIHSFVLFHMHSCKDRCTHTYLNRFQP